MKEAYQIVREYLHYDDATGLFTWIKRPSNRVSIGDEAGSRDAHGYVLIRLRKVNYKAHRLAWLYVYGDLPHGHIDHINGVRDDNRLINLRECSDAENKQNLSLSRKNKSGYPGVSFDRNRGKWFASIQVGGKTKALGRHRTAEDAYRAYLVAKRELHTFQPVPRRSGAKNAA